MKITEQQDIAAEVLRNLLYHVDSDTIIAGGAPRNWDEGKLANDIDIYLRSNAVDSVSMTEAMLSSALGFKVKQKQNVDCTNYNLGISFSIKKIFAFEYKGVLFQLIFIEPQEVWGKGELPTKVVNHFDLGINMIYASWGFLGNPRNLNKTSAYDSDRKNRTLTMYKDNMSYQQLRHCLSNHLPKMQKYYPDYKLVIK